MIKKLSGIHWVIFAVILVMSVGSCNDDNGDERPRISSLTASPNVIKVNETCTLTCAATHPEGDVLTYIWQTTSGSISGAGSVVTWTAPNSVGRYTVVCKVVDSDGDEDIATVEIEVIEAGLTAPVQVSPLDGTVFSHYPRETTLVWEPVTGADSYTVEVEFQSGTTWHTWRLTSDITATTYMFNFVGAQPGRWRVWAVADGEEGPKSGWWEFRYTI